MKRRSFLKITSFCTAAAMSPASLIGKEISAISSNLVQNGTVLTGAHWGILKLTIKDGKVIKSEPWKNASTLRNDLQEFTPDLIYKNRVKYPYVRKSFLQDPLHNKPELRGKDEWVRVGWDEALKLVSEALLRTRTKYGASGIFAGSYGWKSSGNIHNSRTLLHRFMNLTGGFVGSLGDYSTGASQVIMPHVVGSIEVYEQQTNWELVLEHTKTLVIWGANPIDTLKIAWTVSDNEGLAYFEKLKKSGINIICIDPYASSTVKFFGSRARHIKPRPNTDVAMMLGIMHTLVANNLHSKDFLDDYTVGYEKFERYLLGKSDGIEKTSKWAAKICGIDAKTIEQLAFEFAKNRTMLLSGWGMQRAHHGEQPHWALVTLAAMLGQIGKEGGGFGLSYHYSNGGVATAKGAVVGGVNANSVGKWKNGRFYGVVGASFDSNGHLIAGSEENSGNTGQSWLAKTTENAIPVARIADMLLNPGKKIQHNGKQITYANIDFIYWVGGNPFVHHQDLRRLRKAWQKPSCVVVNEIYWTPTARHADILLPATSEYERNDISMGGDYSNKFIVPIKQAVEPVGESKDDYEIFSELAKIYTMHSALKNGANAKEAAQDANKVYNAYRSNMSPLEQVEYYYNLAKTSYKGDEMPEFSEFWSKNEPISFEADDEAYEFVRFADFIDDPVLNPLGTPSGLIEIYSETIEKMNYKDCPAHPTWLEPIEWLGMKEKPATFHMISPHPTSRLHSQLCHTSLRDEYAVNGHEPLLMNAKDASKLGIKDGDLVEVYNARGKAIAGVRYADVLSGVVVLAEGGWYDPNEYSNCNYGCANVLTIDLPTSQLANGNISHTALVNIKKFKGLAPQIKAFTPPVE